MDSVPSVTPVTHEWVLVAVVAIPAMCALLGTVITVVYQARKTRSQGTDEHRINSDAIKELHADVRGVKSDVSDIKADVRDLKDADRQHDADIADIRSRQSHPLYGLGEGK